MVDAAAKRSICIGWVLSCGASSCQPLELSLAVALVFAWTDRIETYTWSNAPFGNAQLGGSVILTLIVPVLLPDPDPVPEPVPVLP